MNLLMIGFDHTVAMAGSHSNTDTRQRHLKYERALQRSIPGSRIIMLVRAPIQSEERIIEEDGLIVHLIPCRRPWFLPKLLLMADSIARRFQIDLITTQTPFDDGLAGVILSRRWNVPLQVQMRSSFLDCTNWIAERPVVYGIFNVLGKFVARKAHSVRVVSSGEKNRLETRFRWLRGKVVFLPPLVNFKTFGDQITAPDERAAKDLLGQSRSAQHGFILFVGRLAKEKDLPTLLKAYARLRQDDDMPGLVIAGDGPLRGALERMARKLGINSAVCWLGAVHPSSLRGLYARAICTVLPSRHEGFGKVIAESYLMWTPVVTTPIVSAAELIQDGVTGYVVPFADDGKLAEKVNSLLGGAHLAREMGARGRRHILHYLPAENEYLDRLVNVWLSAANPDA